MSETLLWNVRPAVSDLDALVAAYVEEVTALLRPDAVLFGHSMGAVVAYHVLRALRERPRAAGHLPRTLVLSASCAPQHVPAEGYADLSDSALPAHLRGFGAIPDEVAAESSLVELFLPAFRADYRVLAQARRRPIAPLDADATLVLADADPCTPPGTAAAWRGHLTRAPRVHRLPGDHMHVLTAPAPLAAVLDGLSVPEPQPVALAAGGVR